MERKDPNIAIKRHLESFMRGQNALNPTDDDSVISRLKTANKVKISLGDDPTEPVQPIPCLRPGAILTIPANDRVRYDPADPDTKSLRIDSTYINEVLSKYNAYATFSVQVTVTEDSGPVTANLFHGEYDVNMQLASDTELTKLNDNLYVELVTGAEAATVESVTVTPSIMADCYRIIASKRVSGYDPDQRDPPDRQYKLPNLAITFFEERGNKDPYHGIVQSIFVFRVWGKSLSEAHKLWRIMDMALHDQNNVLFDDMKIYHSLRAATPQMDFEQDINHPNTTDFVSAYDIAYSEY